MDEVRTAIDGRPAWVDLASSDAPASREFYARLFGWDVVVSPDPQFGGYAMAAIAGREVAGIGPTMAPGQPTSWAVHIGTSDVDEIARKVRAAGGTVVAPPMNVGDLGRLAVLQDPIGAHISAWQPVQMRGFHRGVPNTFGWAELNARGLEGAVTFYEKVFGWRARVSDTGDGAPPYTEFLVDGEAVAGAMEMAPMVPAQVPSFWLVYFSVVSIDDTQAKAVAGGAELMMGSTEYPGGRFAILRDPQGATFGLITTHH
jgi:predicted enzyme related to lactoylglutathione lyase